MTCYIVFVAQEQTVRLISNADVRIVFYLRLPDGEDLIVGEIVTIDCVPFNSKCFCCFVEDALERHDT